MPQPPPGLPSPFSGLPRCPRAPRGPLPAEARPLRRLLALLTGAPLAGLPSLKRAKLPEALALAAAPAHPFGSLPPSASLRPGAAAPARSP